MEAPCIQVPCECGACYLPHSAMGSWLWVRARRLRTQLRIHVLHRPGRYGRHGELLVPVWVYQAFADREH